MQIIAKEESYVKYYHESEGRQMAREKYLVIHVREEVKRVSRKCRECARRFKVKPLFVNNDSLKVAGKNERGDPYFLLSNCN